MPFSSHFQLGITENSTPRVLSPEPFQNQRPADGAPSCAEMKTNRPDIPRNSPLYCSCTLFGQLALAQPMRAAPLGQRLEALQRLRAILRGPADDKPVAARPAAPLAVVLHD